MTRVLLDFALVGLWVNGLMRVMGIRSLRYYLRHGKPCVFCEGTGECYPVAAITKAEYICGACGGATDVTFRGWTDEGNPMPTCAHCGGPALNTDGSAVAYKGLTNG